MGSCCRAESGSCGLGKPTCTPSTEQVIAHSPGRKALNWVGNPRRTSVRQHTWSGDCNSAQPLRQKRWTKTLPDENTGAVNVPGARESAAESPFCHRIVMTWTLSPRSHFASTPTGEGAFLKECVPLRFLIQRVCAPPSAAGPDQASESALNPIGMCSSVNVQSFAQPFMPELISYFDYRKGCADVSCTQA